MHFDGVSQSTEKIPRKGRGATTNRTGRFEPQTRDAFDDGWWQEDPPERIATSLSIDATRTIIARNDSPDVGFDQSINPYRGCEHGCIYCFARPSHAYLGLSPGLDFETRLFCKPDAATLLDGELRNPKYRCRVIAMGTNTDPYQPVERTQRIMRGVLEVLAAFNHPVSIVTKSALVVRDRDILGLMAAKNLCNVGISVTTLDSELARTMEPRAATPARRIAAIKALADAGVPTAVMVAPVIPGLTDHELERIMEAAREAGARRASYVLLRMPHEIKDLFQEWLETHAPLRAAHVTTLIRETRGGKLYDSTWGKRQTGTGAYAALLARRFDIARIKLGFEPRWTPLDNSQFRPPPRAGDQLTLL
ncbi:MAG TPA: PA0069 family radical SAM protein [Alphaproteobacteria bacterium]